MLLILNRLPQRSEDWTLDRIKEEFGEADTQVLLFSLILSSIISLLLLSYFCLQFKLVPKHCDNLDYYCGINRHEHLFRFCSNLFVKPFFYGDTYTIRTRFDQATQTT